MPNIIKSRCDVSNETNVSTELYTNPSKDTMNILCHELSIVPTIYPYVNPDQNLSIESNNDLS